MVKCLGMVECYINRHSSKAQYGFRLYIEEQRKKTGKYTQPINCHELLKEVVFDDGFSFDKYIEEKAHMRSQSLLMKSSHQ